MRAKIALLAVAAAVFATSALAQGVLMVANSDDVKVREVEGYISVFDPNTGALLDKIPDGGVMAHELIVTRDRKTVYAPIYGTGAVGGKGSDGSTISIIDVAARKVVGHLDLGRGVRPHYGVTGPDGRLYVTTELDQAVIVIDPKTRKVIGSIPTGQPESHNIALSNDGRRLYASNVYAGTISVMDVRARKLLDVIKVTKEPRPASGTRANWRVQRIAVSADDKRVFTCDWESGDLAAIDTASRQVVHRTPMASPCYGITITPDGRWLLASNNTANKISVVDTRSLEVVRTVDVPAGPQGILIRPDAKIAYVSNAQAKSVVAIRLSDWTVEKVMPTGVWPDGMVFAGVRQ